MPTKNIVAKNNATLQITSPSESYQIKLKGRPVQHYSFLPNIIFYHLLFVAQPATY